jgi:hypothetical protein
MSEIDRLETDSTKKLRILDKAPFCGAPARSCEPLWALAIEGAGRVGC